MELREFLANAAVAAPTRPAVPSSGYPQGGANPTKPGAYWYHQLSEEERNVLLAASLAPDATVLTQKRDAINILIRLLTGATATATGTADALVGAYTPAVPAFVNGLTVYARAASANATTTPTFTPNTGTLAAKTIVKGAGAALEIGDISGSGHELQLRYNSTLDKWVLINPATGINLLPVFARLLTSAGYQKLPGGLILQWSSGSNTASSGTQSITLPVTFPNANLLSFVTSTYATANQGGAYAVTATTASTVTVGRNNVDNANGVTPLVLSIGY